MFADRTLCSQFKMNRTQSSSTGSLMSSSSQFSPSINPTAPQPSVDGGSGEVFDGSAELLLAGAVASASRITRVEVACGDFVFALRVTYNNGKTLRHGEAPVDGRKLHWAQKWRSRASSSYMPSRFENAKWKGFSLSKVCIVSRYSLVCEGLASSRVHANCCAFWAPSKCKPIPWLLARTNVDMQDEFILEVGGTSGVGLKSLWFRTNRGQYGPFGKGSGTPFQQSFPQGNSLSYFFGRVKYSGETTQAETVPCTVVTELGFGYSPTLGSSALRADSHQGAKSTEQCMSSSVTKFTGAAVKCCIQLVIASRRDTESDHMCRSNSISGCWKTAQHYTGGQFGSRGTMEEDSKCMENDKGTDATKSSTLEPWHPTPSWSRRAAVRSLEWRAHGGKNRITLQVR